MNNVRCVLVRPHCRPEVLQIENDSSAFQSRLAGSFVIRTVPELGPAIGLIMREDGYIFTPECNRPLFDENGKLTGCIYGDFYAVGIEDSMFRSLTDKELIQVIRVYEQPYTIVIDRTCKEPFVACIPEIPAEPELQA